MMFYRYISENWTNYINEGEIEAGNEGFDYAQLSDDEAKQAREDLVQTKWPDSQYIRSGKSFSAKREISNVFLASNDNILIADLEAEYYPLVQRLGGQVIKISPASRQYVNPMNLNLDYSDDESPLSLKVDFLLSFCDIVVGSKDGLQPIEKTAIDRCVRLVYRQYLETPARRICPFWRTCTSFCCNISAVFYGMSV